MPCFRVVALLVLLALDKFSDVQHPTLGIWKQSFIQQPQAVTMRTRI